MRLSLFFSFVLSLLFACQNEPKAKQHTISAADHQAIKNTFVKANQQLLQKENDDMDVYAQLHQLQFITTPSGVRYCVYKPATKGDSIKPGQSVEMEYNVSLLDGTECYSSKTEGKKVFIVEEAELESGLHRGLTYLKRGDRAIFLIPSPLAHGLLGDMKKIPPQMPIVYDVYVK